VPEKIGAAFTNGILTVTLPKSEDAKPKTIHIEAK
jgi:HSP20 family molecular chaperone IbpA